MRTLAREVAGSYLARREALGFPLLGDPDAGTGTMGIEVEEDLEPDNA